MRTVLIIAIVACVMAVAAGSKHAVAEDQGKPHVSSEAKGTHADAGVKPGSHEDWCAEHAVPESLCTRCNPSLSAAFKATGDWCEEHGLPESQCLACNPNLKIERPPKAGAR